MNDPLDNERLPSRRLHEFPEIFAQWHPTLNGELDPATLSAGSHRNVWWKCNVADDHVWRAQCNSRTQYNTACPMCMNRKLSVTNSLEARFPDIARQLHPTLNGGVVARDIVAGVKQTFWWKCDVADDHVWRASSHYRVRHGGRECPFCSSRRPSVSNSLSALFPDIARQLHPTLNGDVTGETLLARGDKSVWWQCPDVDDHAWRAKVSSRTGKRRTRCCYCTNRSVSPNKSLDHLYPKIARQLHPDRNGDLTAKDLAAQSNQSVWWLCPDGHSWQAKVFQRTVQQRGCTECPRPGRGRSRHPTGTTLTAFPEIASQFWIEANGGLTPDDVTYGSTSIFKWKCPDGPDHEWESSAARRTSGQFGDGGGCPFCRGTYVSVTNSLAALFAEIAAEWHPSKNGSVTAAQITAHSRKDVWWRCANGHEWKSRVSARTAPPGSGCPKCYLASRRGGAQGR